MSPLSSFRLGDYIIEARKTMITFKSQSELWLAEQENRKLRPSSLRSYRSIIHTHLNPRFSDIPLADLAKINNKALRELVADLERAKKAAATIRLVAQTFKAVLDSPVDDNGVPVFRCIWNNGFANLPNINPLGQRAPIITANEINNLVSTHRDRLLFGILAGTGARIGEILALTTDDWDQDAGILFVRQSKTVSGVREIDLPWQLNSWLQAGLGDIKSHSRLFPYTTAAYRKRAAGVTGFAHSFRRFRLTHLRKTGMPEDLLRLALGHSDRSISDRYSRLKLDRGFRREWTDRCGLGFTFAESFQPHVYLESRHDGEQSQEKHDRF